MEENNVPAQRRTNSTYLLNIASGFQAIAATCDNPEEDSAPGDCTAQLRLTAA
jgi:hypothetical protein